MVLLAGIGAILITLGLRAGNVCSGARLTTLARAFCPVALLALVPPLLHVNVWEQNPIVFAVGALVLGLGLERAVPVALLSARVGTSRLARRSCRLSKMPLRQIATVAVLGAVLFYAGYFGYYTVEYHRNGHSSAFDLGIEDNIMWHAAHGGVPFTSTPIYGALARTHFERHANLIAYAIAPIYRLAPGAETLLWLQAILLGASAFPLYLIARGRIGAVGGAVLAVSYLAYAPLHGSNLYDFHFLTIAPFFVLWLLWALDTRRDVLAGLLFVVALSVREDIAIGLTVVGLSLIQGGRARRAGWLIALASAGYFLLMKFVLMPPEGDAQSFLYHYEGLLPRDERSFGGLAETLLTNPWFVLSTLVTEPKIEYLLLVLGPVLFLPVRRWNTLLFLIPGAVLTLLVFTEGARVPAPLQISFQYTAHWSPYVFFATALSLSPNSNWPLAPSRKFQDGERGPNYKRIGTLAGLCVASVLMSRQFGAVLQQETARSAFDAFAFGTSTVDLERRAARSELLALIPADAKVAASERVVPHVSARSSAYTLRTGVWDAQYVVFEFDLPWVRPDDMRTVRRVLADGSFGVVRIERPYALLRRGHSTAENRKLLLTIAHR